MYKNNGVSTAMDADAPQGIANAPKLPPTIS
jgi:hypothetical protein